MYTTESTHSENKSDLNETVDTEINIDTTGMTSAEIRNLKLSRFNRTAESDYTLSKNPMTEEDITEMNQIINKQGQNMTKYWYDKLESQATSHWNKFYKNNSSNFFKDRHYLHREIPGLIEHNDDFEEGKRSDRPVLLEVGCGVGNTCFPLLADFPTMKVLCCDCAESAISIVKKHENYDEDRVDAHVCDISQNPLPFESQSADFATLVYVMSALNPRDIPYALKEVRRVMKPNGILLMRDYAVGDLTMLRFKSGSKIGERFYMRGDGTRTYFFEREELKSMLKQAGFLVEDDDVMYIKKIIENRKRDIQMKRIWLQCKVVCDPDWVDSEVFDSNHEDSNENDSKKPRIE